jgi:hypothetical protein
MAFGLRRTRNGKEEKACVADQASDVELSVKTINGHAG